MTINFYLDSKLLKNGEKSIVCFVRGIKNCKTIIINTQLKIKPVYWNSENQNVRKTFSNYSQYNDYLDKFRNEIKSAYIEYDKIGKPFETNTFKEYLKDMLFKKSEKPKKDFFDVFEIYLDSIKNEFTKVHIDTIISFKKFLINFQKHTNFNITFTNIDLKFYDSFINYCIKVKGFKNNTTLKRKKLLVAFLNWAEKRNYHKNTQFKQFKAKAESTEVIALTHNEIMKLYNLDLDENTIIYHIRNLFCLSCFTGARFSDIMNLKFEDILNDTWHLRTKKTRDIIEIPLINHALEIIEKYKNANQNFPKIDKNKYNNELKNIAKLAEINTSITKVEYVGAERIEVIKPKYEFVSSHMGRRTFVTLSLEKGMRPEIVMKITGHKDYKTFKRYIEITSKVKHQEMMKAWN